MVRDRRLLGFNDWYPSCCDISGSLKGAVIISWTERCLTFSMLMDLQRNPRMTLILVVHARLSPATMSTMVWLADRPLARCKTVYRTNAHGRK